MKAYVTGRIPSSGKGEMREDASSPRLCPQEKESIGLCE